jgi:hypothetical protein
MSRLQDYYDNGTKLFLGRGGDVCVGPEFVQEGDVVCILFGGRAPFILRRCSDHFHLIGECYVPFWMAGRGVEMAEEGKLKEAWFLLK